MKIAINGFGRIGREILKIALERKIKISAINDPGDIENAAYLLQYDSVYGKFKGTIKTQGKDTLIINNQKIHFLSERDASKLPWKKLGIDLIIESSGFYTKRDDAKKHIFAGAKKVIISAPGEDSDITVVPGVNENLLKRTHEIISVASCTTNAAAPVLKVLNDSFGIKRAMLTTIHAYTNSQSLIDRSDKKFRRGRAGAINIIPTSTGASEAVCLVMPVLKDKLSGQSIRVPIADGSLIDLTVELNKPVTREQINKSFKRASEDALAGIMQYTEDQIVSSDIIGNPNSTIIDGLSTASLGSLIKVLSWYDNEYGYSNRVLDVIEILEKMK